MGTIGTKSIAINSYIVVSLIIFKIDIKTKIRVRIRTRNKIVIGVRIRIIIEIRIKIKIRILVILGRISHNYDDHYMILRQMISSNKIHNCLEITILIFVFGHGQ